MRTNDNLLEVLNKVPLLLILNNLVANFISPVDADPFWKIIILEDMSFTILNHANIIPIKVSGNPEIYIGKTMQLKGPGIIELHFFDPQEAELIGEEGTDSC